MKHRNN